MNSNILSGDIIPSYLYKVAGGKSVTYNSVSYSTGQTFRGMPGVKVFTYSGTGSEILNQVSELCSFNLEYENSPELSDTTAINGFAIEFEMNKEEYAVSDVTVIKGFALEMTDFPFYAFEITETR
jgi:hypothetical protein